MNKPLLSKNEQILVAHALSHLFKTIHKDGGKQYRALEGMGVIPHVRRDSNATRNDWLMAVRNMVEEILEICPGCHNRGWAVFAVDGSAFCKDGTLAIQKCDECEDKPWGYKNDLLAAQSSGLKFTDNGHHCIIKPRNVPEWLQN